MHKLIVVVILIIAVSPVVAQRIEYPPEEFQQRRTALCAQLKEPGTVMLFAETSPPIGVRFRHYGRGRTRRWVVRRVCSRP